MPKVLELTGQQFGKLTVIRKEGRDKTGNITWLCECECGETTVIPGCRLTNGWTRSCGCMMHQPKHGMSNTKLYKDWTGMKSRCSCVTDPKYKGYGERGIRVCDEWKNSFQAFYDDVSKLPHFGEAGYSLDRVDNDGDYEPGNVRWADGITQGSNKRNNVLLTYNSETHTQAEWARKLGMSTELLYYRLSHGWSVEDALTTPVRRR